MSRAKTAGLVVLTLILTGFSAGAAAKDVPDRFLPPPNAPIRRALDQPVSGTFRAATAREVLNALVSQVRVDCVMSGPIDHAPFTGEFGQIPFRTALYRWSLVSNLVVEWGKHPDGSLLISIHDRPDVVKQRKSQETPAAAAAIPGLEPLPR